ncbi:unnamed protein product [Vitrella brassicaformis CCMP3155]|uniref:Uncharacterized protein n=2 Tax=Vitrella brassicaformis TaxID=1169539 RepID=A0A0G4ELJ2_VITBC|nr:unnamed protein product [Vitrella brassicaformis CCMP3155]|eukprot:CEL98288.1 unnamed protein product [Vitrella brassicaformis CCMP3155]
MMKVVAAVALLAVCANAFVPQGVLKRDSPLRKSLTRPSMAEMGESDRSLALPMDKRPPNLDGSLPGDFGFDPVGFSNNLPRTWLIGGDERSLKWYREAELVHSRVAMLAALGWIFPEIWHLPGNAAVGVDAFAETNPWKALTTVPKEGLWQIAGTVSAIEFFRLRRVVRGEKEAGDLGLGQGEGRWNPFGFAFDEDEYYRMQVREIKNGRLAMIAIIGMMLQAAVTGEGLLEQIGEGFGLGPGYRLPAGTGLQKFFPEGL